jgi:sRNA-binding protein
MSVTIDKQKTNEIIAHLAKRFLHCFSISHTNRRALKIGIRADLAPLVAFSAEDLERALRYYTRSDGFLRACIDGVPRIDLDGNVAGTVTAKEAAWAQKVLVERELWRAKSNAAREQRQPASYQRGEQRGGRNLERKLHRQFAHIRARGEWFHRTPELLTFIEQRKHLGRPV